MAMIPKKSIVLYKIESSNSWQQINDQVRILISLFLFFSIVDNLLIYYHKAFSNLIYFTFLFLCLLHNCHSISLYLADRNLNIKFHFKMKISVLIKIKIFLIQLFLNFVVRTLYFKKYCPVF